MSFTDHQTIKIIFDLEIIANSYKKNETGIYRVAYELLKNLLTSDEIELFYSNFNYNNNKNIEYIIDEFLIDQHFDIPQINTCKRIKFLPFRKEKPIRKLYNRFGIYNYKISFSEKVKEAQIYHSLYFPINKSLDKFPHLKKVVTVHDLIPILFPQYSINTELLENTVRSIGKDNYAICVSENTKKDLLNYAPYIDPERVFVTLLAASEDLFYQCKDKDKFREVQLKYNIPDQYFLSLSTLEPRKNIDHIIRSFVELVTSKKMDDLSLVLVGDKGWDFDKIFDEYENAQEAKNRIIITGRIPDEDLASIYSNANSFYYMSFYEGFGLPPLEAMQCGTATVVSNTSSLPEVVGDAGVQLDPKDQEKLVETMWRMYSDDFYRNELAARALERSKNFSWKKNTQQHIDIYKKILQF